MPQRIIYENPEGGVCVIAPTDEILSIRTIEEVAKKDVPPGLPFKIVDISEVPTDRSFRNAWEVDSATLTDGVGNLSNEFTPVGDDV